ncbi:MAG: RNB domain-containing ribonuclease [Ardenticatenales bacterium]
MTARGLLPEFSPTVLAEVDGLHGPAQAADDPSVRDLRSLLWASIDNDDSRDLDQLSWAERVAGDAIRVLVAVADVDALVRDGSAIDAHARVNTTSVYTAARIFSMLPERLSTDLTSLNDDEDRVAMIVEMTVGRDGALRSSDVYRGRVRNRAKLAYNGVAAWLDGHAPAPAPIAAVPGLDDALRLQDEAAQSLRALRHIHGALTLETIEARPVFDGEKVSGLEVQERNRAKDIIEDFMVAANGVTARFLAERNLPSIRRVVRTPKRWDRIVSLAAEHGVALPAEPDSKALDAFLVRAKAADPQRFPDLSLTIIKLMGAGEYTAELPGAPVEGHFGLAVKDYAHSTAPNRRYADLITQRLLKAALAGRPSPYNGDALVAIAEHLTAAEDAANRVERQVGKSAAALLLDDKIGQQFEAFVTGASDKGTWVRLIDMPVEGRVEKGAKGLDVGDRTRVRLLSVDVDRGFIDFENLDRAAV